MFSAGRAARFRQSASHREYRALVAALTLLDDIVKPF